MFDPTCSNVLIVSPDCELRDTLSDVLNYSGNFCATGVTEFGDALSAILTHRYAFALIEVDLPEMSGLDLLAVIGRLCPWLPVMIIDDELQGKSAMAAFRLGAVDYLIKPLNIELALIRIHHEMERNRQRHVKWTEPVGPKQQRINDRERWINPALRPAALMLRRNQYVTIEKQLAELHDQIQATFVGLVDDDHNIISGIGEMRDHDLMALKRVLSADYGSTRLAGLLDEKNFSHMHLEGHYNSVFIISFGRSHPVSLVAICPADAKPGMVWLWLKRTAEALTTIFAGAASGEALLPTQPSL